MPRVSSEGLLFLHRRMLMGLPLLPFQNQMGPLFPRQVNIMTRRKRRSVFVRPLLPSSEINGPPSLPSEKGFPFIFKCGWASSCLLFKTKRQSFDSTFFEFAAARSPPPQFATGGELRKVANASVAWTPSPNISTLLPRHAGMETLMVEDAQQRADGRTAKIHTQHL